MSKTVGINKPGDKKESIRIIKGTSSCFWDFEKAAYFRHGRILFVKLSIWLSETGV